MLADQTLSDMLEFLVNSEPNDKQTQNMPRKNHFDYELILFQDL